MITFNSLLPCHIVYLSKLVTQGSRYRYSTYNEKPPLDDSLSVLKYIRTSLIVRITMNTDNKNPTPLYAYRDPPCTNNGAPSYRYVPI